MIIRVLLCYFLGEARKVHIFCNTQMKGKAAKSAAETAALSATRKEERKK